MEGWTGRTHVEEVLKNEVGLVLGKFNNSLGESFVDEDALPASDS